MTTGAAMAATGTELPDDPVAVVVVDTVAEDVDTVETGAGVIGAVEVLFF